MRYIEKDFPIEKLNEIARKEGNAKKPIYQIHKWWARRLGSVFRTILLTSFLPDGITEEEFWENYYYKKTDLKDILGHSPIILDPFMGGGTTIVEALRLGIKPIGIDINPVAWFVTKKEVEPLDLDAFEKEFKKLEEKVGEKIKSYYKTRCPICEKENSRTYEWDEGNNELADVMYVFWVNKVKCLNPTCKKDVHLFPSFKIAMKKNKKEGTRHTVFCPKCMHIFDAEKDYVEVECPECSFAFIPMGGYVSRGKYHCPNCGQIYNVLDSVRKSGHIPEREMYAIEYYCPVHGRGYKKADEHDIGLFEKAKKELEEQWGDLIGKYIPDQEIPDGYNTKQMKNFGYRYFYEMFNERQLLCLSMLLKEILKIEDDNLMEFMLLEFSSSLDWNNMFVQYNITSQKNQPLFGRHAYWPLMQPSENNVWGTEYGSGPFITHIRKLVRGKEYIISPTETNFNNEGKTFKITVNDTIITHMGVKLEDVFSDKNCLLKSETSEDLSYIPDRSLDGIITDPSYYDNVMYSELADFFFIWLRLGLRNKYPYFASETTRNKREIIKNEIQNKDDDFFLKGIQRVYTEADRVLKDEGIFVFTFHHKETEAWASMLKPVLASGLYITAVYPIHSETRTPSHILGKRSISYDTIIVCRKRVEVSSEVSWNSLKIQIYGETKKMIERLLKTRPHLGEGDVKIIAMGKGLELYSKHYPMVLFKNGYLEPRDATFLMDEMVDLIIGEVKESELPSALDVISKIYIGYLLGESYVEYDSLNKILRSMSFDIPHLEREKLIEKGKKNQYKVEGAAKRFSFINEKIDGSENLTYVDKIHYMIYQYRRGKPIMNLIAKWKDDTLSTTLKIYYDKTKDEVCKEIYDMIEKHIEMKMPLLESFGRGSDESDTRL